MKKLSVLVLTSVLFFSPGCATFQGDNTSRRIQTAAKLAAYVGATEYIRAHPETRPAFQLARDQLIQIESSEHVDLILLLSIINSLPVKELKSDRAQLIVTAATIILSDYAGALPIEKLDNLKPEAKSIREGLDLALAVKIE